MDGVRSIDCGMLAAAYADGASPVDVIAPLLAAIAAAPDDAIWIARVPDEIVLARARTLATIPAAERSRLPLFGVPFAVKDNIDVAGMPTTAGCPAFATVPERSSTAFERLERAGAILIGKTNLDQFATGLVGTRSPYGVARNPFDAAYIPGGSSSGSAVAVARGFASFALGTDTAGSGRIPAGFTATVGLKPTRGIVSTRGVVPACRSLDCVSIFATAPGDAAAVLDVLAAVDPEDAFSRPRERRAAIADDCTFAVPRPEQLTFFGDLEAEHAFADALARIATLGTSPAPVDCAPCFEAAALLYGPFVAERTAALGDFIAAQPDAVLDVTRTIIEGGRRYTAVDLFVAQYRLEALRRRAATIFRGADILVVPTAPTIYRVDEVAAEPYLLNSRLGTYTNFVNLLDYCALAIPSARYANGLPIGITLIAPAFNDDLLIAAARRLTGVLAG